MGFPAQNHLAWKICLSILHVLAFLWTGVRLRHRLMTRFWWDDAFVVAALIFDIFFFVHFWVKYKDSDILWVSNPHLQGFLWSFWFMGFLYSSVVWLSRIGLMLSIARIFTARNYLRRVAIALAGVFFLFYTVISVVAAVSCKRVEGQPWYVLRYDQCIKVIKDETLSAILGYILDFLADIILIIFPLFLVKTMQMRRRTRVLLVIIFCGSFVTLGASITFISTWYSSRFTRDGQLMFVVMGHLQGALSLIIANLLVDVLIIYRFLHKSTGLSTFSDGVDSEVITDSRAVEATRETRTECTTDDLSSNNTSSLGGLTMTSISSTRYTISQVSNARTTSFCQIPRTVQELGPE